ncbi:MAG: hypothetical protein ACXWQQ_10125 [Pseudobdellovibrio sp.]
MTPATEKAKQVLLFISHQPDDLKIVISFLKKRNFVVHIESDIKTSITSVFDIKPDFIFLAWDHPDKKMLMLPKILTQSVASVIVPFINKNSKDGIFKIEQCPSPKLYPPLSGPAVERLILKSGREDSEFIEKVNKFKTSSNQQDEIEKLQKKIASEELAEAATRGAEKPPADPPALEALSEEEAEFLKQPPPLEGEELVKYNEKRNQILSKAKINLTEEQKQGLKNTIEDQVKAPLESILQSQTEQNAKPKKPKQQNMLIFKKDESGKPKKSSTIIMKGGPVAPPPKKKAVEAPPTEVPAPEPVSENYNVYCISIVSPNWCGYFLVSTKTTLDFNTIDLVFTDWIKQQLKNIEDITSRDYFEFTDVEQATLDDIKKISDYSESLNAYNTDFNINFFSVEPKDMKVDFNTERNYIKIFTEDIPTEVSLDFDVLLHLPKNEKYLIYTNRSNQLKEDQKVRLLKNDVSLLYVTLDHEHEYRNFLVGKTFSRLHEMINKKLGKS